MNGQIWRIVRFGVVGSITTLSYLAFSFVFLHVIANAGVANFLAMLSSLAVSYFGHHRFTFRNAQGHRRSLPRFAVSSAILIGIFSLLSYLYIDVHGGKDVVVMAVTAIGYPALSFLLHSLELRRPLAGSRTGGLGPTSGNRGCAWPCRRSA